MLNSRLFNSALSWSATTLAATGMIATMLPMAPAAAASRRGNRICADTLLDAGISEEEVALACARALQPRTVSRCVNKIVNRTSITGPKALEGCTQVRRPNELASCVVDIGKIRDVADLTDVLDYCQRSLLPRQFGNCVVALSAEIGIAPKAAMDTCIGTSDIPTDLAPTFIPSSESDTPEIPKSESDQIKLTPLVPIQ
ncbi:MAG: hypothetical protein F6K19_34795 [Cyanothece sp. SIO1E1]|nr:hypothetical protein [Cyanothece sp. SIO1E1]